MEEKKYPIGGYAPGNYHNRCATCERTFFGDKRACQCEPCAVAGKAAFDAMSPEEQEVLLKKNAVIANYMFSGPLSPERDLIYRIVEQWGNAIEMPNMEQWLKDYAGNRRTGSVWVKAKDRLPEKQIYVIVRNIETGQVKLTQNYGHNTGWDIAMDRRFKWDNTEWLDEANEQPVEQKENDAVIKWFFDNRRGLVHAESIEQLTQLYNEYQKQKP
jgi:hypothetical protein